MSPRRGRQFWERVVADLERSELTHEEFATQRRINVGSLRGWLYRLRRERERGADPRLLPVRVGGTSSGGGRMDGFVEVGVAGAVVRVTVGTDVEYVAELVTQLRARC
jgi:hypothetical protein